MIKKFLSVLIIFTLILNTSVKADGDDEGMWLPLFIERLNYVDMQKAGLQLTAEELVEDGCIDTHRFSPFLLVVSSSMGLISRLL